MKKVATILFSIAYCLTSIAQQAPWNETNKKIVFDRAQFIFEGAVIKKESYKAGGMIYTSNTVQVTKIFRGADKIKTGTIEIVTEGGSVGETVETYQAVIVEGGGTSAQITTNGIYFCVPSTYDPSRVSVDNSIRVMAMAEIKYEFLSGSSFGFGKQFNNKLEVFKFLADHKDIDVPVDKNAEAIVLEEIKVTVPDIVIEGAKSYIISRVGAEFYDKHIAYDDNLSKASYKYRGMVIFNVRASESPLVNKIVPIQIKDSIKGIVDSTFTPLDKEQLSTCIESPDQCALPMDRNTAIEIARAEGFEQGTKGWEINLVVWAGVKGDYRWSISNTLGETPEGHKGAYGARGNSIVINAITGVVKHSFWSGQE